MLVKPGHDLTVDRIDEAMAEAQPVIAPGGVDAKRGAFDMKAGAGAQFAREADIEPAGQIAAARQIAEAKFVGEIGFRLLHPVEVISDREMLGHIALPGRHRAAIRLDPIRHCPRPLEKYPRPLPRGIARHSPDSGSLQCRERGPAEQSAGFGGRRHARNIAATWSRWRMRAYIFIALSRL